MTIRQNRNSGPDNLLLPRSWILRALAGPLGVLTHNPPLTVLLGAVGNLLRKLFLWASSGWYFLYSRASGTNAFPRPLSSQTSSLSSGLTSTICSGFTNVRSADLTLAVDRRLSELPLYVSFLDADFWCSVSQTTDFQTIVLSLGQLDATQLTESDPPSCEQSQNRSSRISRIIVLPTLSKIYTLQVA